MDTPTSASPVNSSPTPDKASGAQGHPQPEKQCLVHCHGPSPDGTDQGQNGPEGKKAFALEAPSGEKSFYCLRRFSGKAEWERERHRITCGKEKYSFLYCDFGQDLRCVGLRFLCL